jgi:beta-glucanase (GH16 family)
MIKSRLMKQFAILLICFFALNQLSAQCYSLVWQDDFNGTSLDTSMWNRWVGTAYNNELQYYTARPENIAVSNGTLKLKGLAESYAGSNYTSGRIDTRYKADHTYGKIEGRMKIPAGQGLWPAFWMLPTDGLWPAGGEIDIMEILGQTTNKNYGTCHYAVNGVQASMGSYYIPPTGNFADGFHTYTVEWTASTISWKVDGVQYYSVTKTQVGTANWPFNKPFYVVLNLAIGGNWPGSPNAQTVFPANMEVDWVKIYQVNTNLTMTGAALCEPQTPTIYKMPAITGATYAWTIPTGGTIISGQGTPNLTVKWTTQGSFAVNCTVVTACGTQVKSKTITVNANKFNNPSFESNKVDWTLIQYAGASVFTTPVNATAPNGTKTSKLVVSALGSNSWDIQLVKPYVNVLKDTAYTFRFWAKANAAGKHTQVNFLNPTNYTNYSWQNITLTTAWTQYTMTFVAPYTGPLLFTEDFNFQTGTFYTDHYFFGRSSIANLLPSQSETAAFLTVSDADLQAYPNPVADILTIVSPSDGSYILFDATGRSVATGRCDKSLATQISMTDLPSGQYLLELQYENGDTQTTMILRK